MQKRTINTSLSKSLCITFFLSETETIRFETPEKTVPVTFTNEFYELIESNKQCHGGAAYYPEQMCN